MRRFSFVLLATALAALAACGGGGGGGSTAATASSATGSGASDVATSAGESPSTQAAGSMQADAFATLNAARLAAGALPLSPSTALDTSAAEHAAYLTDVLDAASFTAAQNAEIAATSPHDELQDVAPAYFHGLTPDDRMVAAGAVGGNYMDDEVIGGAASVVGGKTVVDGSACARGLLDTAYHADALLGFVNVAGIGQFTEANGEAGCVIDLAALAATSGGAIGQVPASGASVAYPTSGQTTAGTFYIDGESPRPAAGLITTSQAGTPVLFSARNADWQALGAAGTLAPVVDSFTLTGANGAAVAAVVLASSAWRGADLGTDAFLQDGTLILIPTAPLPAGTWTASVAVTLAAGTTLSRTWSFTTYAGTLR